MLVSDMHKHTYICMYACTYVYMYVCICDDRCVYSGCPPRARSMFLFARHPLSEIHNLYMSISANASNNLHMSISANAWEIMPTCTLPLH